MTNDSHLFLTAIQAEQQESKSVPLYVGKMIWHFDHRAAGVAVNEGNLKVAASSAPVSSVQKTNPDFSPEPQYWVAAENIPVRDRRDWYLGFREITNPTNQRTMVSAIVPGVATGNKLPLLLPQPGAEKNFAKIAALLLANLNSFAFDFVIRQKVQGQTINLFILEQLPVIAPARFEEAIGQTKIADFIREQVLHLTYTAHDLAPFARDLGYDGPPFAWDEEDRRARMVALDALFMHLYGLSADDAGWILDGFPIIRAQDEAAFGDFRTKIRILDALKAIGEGRLGLP